MTAEETGARLEAMVEAVAARLAAAGEELRPGDRIITGVLAPPHEARAGRHGAPRARGTGRRGAALLVASGGMSTDAATLPDALSEAARSFAAGPHRFVIGGERPEAADGRSFETLDPATGRAIAEVPYAGSRGRGPRRARGARGVRGRPLARDRGRGAHARDARVRRRGRGARGRARRARVARQRQAGEDGRAAWTCRSPPPTSATSRAGRRASTARCCRWPSRTCTATRARSRSAWRRRSSPGTSRC